MSQPNRVYIIVLAIFMVFVLAYVYMCSCNKNEASLKAISVWGKMAGIQNKAQSALEMAGMVPSQAITEDDCDIADILASDDNHEITIMAMEDYLETRRACILKYCGDVCKTKTEPGQG